MFNHLFTFLLAFLRVRCAPQSPQAAGLNAPRRQSGALMLALLVAVGGLANATTQNSELQTLRREVVTSQQTAVALKSQTAQLKYDVAEQKRQTNNATKIVDLHPWMQPKITATLADLEAHGQKPYIVQSYRSLADQQKAKAAGNSTVSWSFHNALTNGRKSAFAVDLVDQRYFFKTGGEFWLLLAAAAQSHELETGIRWGLKTNDRAKIDALIAAHNWNAKYRQGWDAGHTQPAARVLTLGQAKAGKRPTIRNPPKS